MNNSERDTPGPVGTVLADNVRRIREGQRLTYVALAALLAEVGRPIPVLGLRRIERRERRVDADELLALAVVLRVAPVDLLIPAQADGSYQVTPTVQASPNRARNWVAGSEFLVEPQSAAELSDLVRWMPRPRAQAAVTNWASPPTQAG
ncbi:hypothetical protein [Umezawaea tangerina]|uniref:HTH cro/C1-type domain-containing protein n=1 Tax=Umezawaea tangerina TaxID=84725 RepID=A0A2T0SPR6_9PSEU|nr:hypothetical protein [Umezawaea tangerina]PRY35353.1 hypothetical protein CLV43_114271 [Umezawaea tangerina]